jgi:hypothetical protein
MRWRESESSNRARARSEHDSGERQCDNHRTKGRRLPIEPQYCLDENPSNPTHRLAKATSACRCFKSLIERHPSPRPQRVAAFSRILLCFRWQICQPTHCYATASMYCQGDRENNKASSNSWALRETFRKTMSRRVNNESKSSPIANTHHCMTYRTAATTCAFAVGTTLRACG